MGRESKTDTEAELIDRRALLAELRAIARRLITVVEVLEKDLGLRDGE